MIRAILGVATALCLGLNAASAQPKTISLWHPFTLETDMIHGAIKSFNASQTDYRIDPRIVPGTADLDRTGEGRRERIGARPGDDRQSDRRELLGAGNAHRSDRSRRQVALHQA